jgi:hypothetical protein
MIGNPDVNKMYPAVIPVYLMMNKDREIVEVDPAQITVFSDTIDGQQQISIPVFVFAERSDAVQENQLTVTVDGTEVEITDFVYPAWYDSTEVTGPYNHKNTLPRPFSLDPGGYLNFYLDNLYETGERNRGRFYMFRPKD